MSIDDQILKLPTFTIVFLSENCFIVTKDLEKALNTEKLTYIDPELKIRKTKGSIGLIDFNVKSRNNVVNVFIKDKKILLRDIIHSPQNFEQIDLNTTEKYLCFRRNNNIHVVLPKDNYYYLNQANVSIRSTLGNMLYFRGMDKEKFTDIQKVLFKLTIPINYYIFDNRITQEDHKNIIYKNDLSPNNNVYFIDDVHSQIASTGAKQVLTYGFSRNNTLNYFDINMSNNFLELKNYSTNLNYNKNYFTKTTKKEVTLEYTIRQLQFNVFAPVSFCDMIEMEKIPLVEDDYYFKISLKYLKLRHRLIPFLYGAFKEKRIKNIDIYRNHDDQIFFHNQLMYIPIFNLVDENIKQNFVNINFTDTFYDFQSGEKFESETFQFYDLGTMPIFAKKGGIIPLATLNTEIHKSTEYEIKIYPGDNNEYTLYYDEYVQHNRIVHASSFFKLDYSKTKLTLTITPRSLKEFLPNVFHLNFINIRHTSEIKVSGSEFDVDCNLEKKFLLIDIKNTSEVVTIEISNPAGLELDRSLEFYNKKLETFFNNTNCSEKEYNLYKYKLKPYTHESIDLFEGRLNKHFKFIDKKQRNNIIKMLENYKK